MTPYASRPHYVAHMKSVLPLVDDVSGALVASYADLCVARRKGHERIALMQHGIGQSYSDRNAAYPGGDGNDAVGLFLVPNEHAAGRWQAAYPAARVEVVGSPRLDDLPQRVPDGTTTVAVTFHWRQGSIPEARHAFDAYKNAVALLAARYHVIGHGHPRASRLPRFWEKHGIEHVADFDEVCRRADVLVFDNTSAGFEFAATGRPTVVMNAPAYRKHVHHGLRYWDAADVGIQVDDPCDLEEGVERALALLADDVGRREAALDVVFTHRSGAAQRAADAIKEWAA